MTKPVAENDLQKNFDFITMVARSIYSFVGEFRLCLDLLHKTAIEQQMRQKTEKGLHVNSKETTTER